MTIQVAPDDCTGCGVCVDVCPAKSKTEVKHKAIDMEPIAPHLDRERARFDAFLRLDGVPDGLLDPASVKGHRHASRCSSSPARALAAARPRTSSC